MSGQPQSVIGVDIGNSGLRMAKLNPHAIVGSSSSGGIGEVARIDWTPTRPASASTSDESSSRMSYAPDDPKWLLELERILNAFDASYHPSHKSHSSHCIFAPVPNPPSPESCHCLISSVRRDALQLIVDHLSTRPNCIIHVVTYRDVGFKVAVDFPERVGVDRLLAAKAAMVVASDRPLIVVQAGSAVTVDWVSADGTFDGGAIVPGVPMMLRLLAQAADMLPEVEASELTELPSLPGTNTEEAMRCGVSSAVVGGTLHLIERYRAQSSLAVPVILSGGDGPRLAKFIPSPIQVVDQLVLRGIGMVATGKLGLKSADGG